jgi:hypothetical protein
MLIFNLLFNFKFKSEEIEESPVGYREVDVTGREALPYGTSQSALIGSFRPL